jgi:hypothetical protein
VAHHSPDPDTIDIAGIAGDDERATPLVQPALRA